jgi:O-antigen/teichoic acid export membrane protein
MSRLYGSLVRHTAVYGAGQLLMRLSSILLLPVYTRYLSPTDYGVIALLDLAAAVLLIVFGCGIASAAQRYHFEAEGEGERSHIWSTALVLVSIPPIPFLAVAWWARSPLSELTHGAAAVGVADLYTLVLPTVWFRIVNEAADGYLRTYKRSTASVALNLSGLALNVTLNLYLLIVADMGVRGVLLGNMIATGATAVSRAGFVVGRLDGIALSTSTARKLMRFGAPLAGAALLATAMHLFDRYLLRLFRDLDEVGIYALAYTLSQGATSLLLVPFSAAWEAIRYEIAQQSDAARIYARVFRVFVIVMGLIAFGVALFATEIVDLLAAPRFQRAAAYVPTLSLAYLIFSLHLQFSVPAFLHKVPQKTLWSFALGFVTTVIVGLVLVPRFGAHGAAVTTLLSFSAFSFVGLRIYSKLERYPYDIGFFARMVAAMALSFVAIGWTTAEMSVPARIAGKTLVWTGAAAALAWGLRGDEVLVDALRRSLSFVGLARR